MDEQMQINNWFVDVSKKTQVKQTIILIYCISRICSTVTDIDFTKVD